MAFLYIFAKKLLSAGRGFPPGVEIGSMRTRKRCSWAASSRTSCSAESQRAWRQSARSVESAAGGGGGQVKAGPAAAPM
jgi:hypothetical protein